MPFWYLRHRSEDNTVVHYECRDCGKTVNEHTAGCPVCDSVNIGRYEWN